MKTKAWGLVGLIVGIAVAAVVWRSMVRSSSSSPMIDVSSSNLQSAIQKSPQPLILVNLWASWCEPCKVEFPALLGLRKKYPQLELILVSLDNEEQREEALSFLRSLGVDFPTFFKGDKELRHFAQIFPTWQGAIPASFLVNTKLETLDGWFGETTPEEFEQRVLSRLPKP